MRRISMIGLVIMLIFILIISTGCKLSFGLSGSGDKADALSDKKAIDTLAQFSIANELAVLEVLKILSEDFTQPLFSNSVRVSAEDYNNLFSLMGNISVYKNAVETSLAVIIPRELAYNISIKTASLLPVPSPESLNPKSPGILSDFFDFFGFLDGAGKRSRERIIMLSQIASDAQKQQMYEELRSSWKSQAQDYNEWFQKLGNGDFDNIAAQVHNDFSTNPDLGFYADAATAKGERPLDIVHREGGTMIEKGSKFYADVATKVVAAALPGFDKGVKTVKKLNETIEDFKKFKEEFYADNIGAAVTEDAGDYLGSDQSKSVGDAIAHIADTFGGDKSPDKIGTVTIKSQEGDTYQNVVAFNQDDDAPAKMVTYVGEGRGPPVLSLPEGEYFMVAVDKEGKNSGSRESIAINQGQNASIVLEPKQDSGSTTDVMGGVLNELNKLLENIQQGTDKLDEITSGGSSSEKPGAGVQVQVVGSYTSYETDDYRVEASGHFELFIPDTPEKFKDSDVKEKYYFIRGNSSGEAHVWLKDEGGDWYGPFNISLASKDVQGGYSPRKNGQGSEIPFSFSFASKVIDVSETMREGMISSQGGADITGEGRAKGIVFLGSYMVKSPMTGNPVKRDILMYWTGSWTGSFIR